MCQGANTCNKDKALPCALVAFDALLICLSTSYFTSTLITTILFSCTEGNWIFLDISILSQTHLCIFVSILIPSPSTTEYIYPGSETALFTQGKQFLPVVSDPFAALPIRKVCLPFYIIHYCIIYFFKQLDEIFKLLDSLQQFHPGVGSPTCIFYTQGET